MLISINPYHLIDGLYALPCELVDEWIRAADWGSRLRWNTPATATG